MRVFVMRGRLFGLIATVAAAVAATAVATGTPATAAVAGQASGAPGRPSTWATGDKVGFGSARGTASKVWYTLKDGMMTEIFYPRIDTPSTRDTQLVVTDGRTFTDREDIDTAHQVRLLDTGSLTYQQVNRAKSGKYEITKTYVTDPARSTVMVDVRFHSLTGRPYQVYVLHDVALSMTGNDDTGRSGAGGLLATDATNSTALLAAPELTKTSSGYQGRSDGWTDLRTDHRMDWAYRATRPGNVVQTGRTRLSGVGSAQHLTLSVGFGRTTSAAAATAHASLAAGFPRVQREYQRGWHSYLAALKATPASAVAWRTEYRVSAMVLAASEDKTYRGGFVAAPGRPWAWANSLQTLAVYHAVWSRDLYQIATALLAMGDRAAAGRALTYLFTVQEHLDGSYPQNTRLSGEPVFDGLQMDEVSFPTVLAYQLGRTGAWDWGHVKRAEDFVAAHGPDTQTDRWENTAGWSPATIAAEIAGLVCGADIARHNGDAVRARRYLALADAWRRNLNAWTLSTNGPLSSRPYYLRITADGNANAATKIQISDGGPLIDQRRILDPSFLELVRLGILRADDPHIINTVRLVDAELGYSTANGPFWHRASFDGYGEKRDGSEWQITPTGSGITVGRGWPLLTGERGEYALAAGMPAQRYLDTMARAADNTSYFLSEQVWDHQPPSGTRSSFQPGEPTSSATPLAWSHAQLVRLAWSVDAGQPVETPPAVACRYRSTVCPGR